MGIEPTLTVFSEIVVQDSLLFQRCKTNFANFASAVRNHFLSIDNPAIMKFERVDQPFLCHCHSQHSAIASTVPSPLNNSQTLFVLQSKTA